MKSSKNKKIIAIIITLIVVMITLGATYSLYQRVLIGTKKYVIISDGLRLFLDETKTITDVVEGTKVIPVSDFEGKETEGYYFSLVNEENKPMQYSVYLDEDENNTMPIYALRFNLTEEETKLDITGNVIDTGDKGNRKLTTQVVPAHTTHNFTLKVWLGYQAENDAKNKTYSANIRVEATQTVANYHETVLNGTDPVLTDNLIPVLIADDGTVTKANTQEEWYKYEEQRWANAVVLIDNTIVYNNGDTIPESNIESYFVWIPRYKYKIFNMGNYSSLTSISNTAVQTIEVVFETKDIPVSTASAVGDWHSHPAFQAFDSNGFWVGKFETSGENTDTYNPNAIRIKPNVTSWKSITIGIAFQNSYNYLREDESHMIKNTEWGAVAYLQHSIYGSRQSVRINNNSSFLTGYASVSEPTCGYNRGTSTPCNLVGTATNVTLPYNTTTGYLASTTANITGIYDMSGGAHEYVMGYNESASSVGGSSGLTTIYGDFFTGTDWEKYYDKYKSTSNVLYSNRILGDATGEMGPFGNVTDPDKITRARTSWYGDYSIFVTAADPWFNRGGAWASGDSAGIFVFSSTAEAITNISFRIVLTP